MSELVGQRWRQGAVRVASGRRMNVEVGAIPNVVWFEVWRVVSRRWDCIVGLGARTGKGAGRLVCARSMGQAKGRRLVPLGLLGGRAGVRHCVREPRLDVQVSPDSE